MYYVEILGKPFRFRELTRTEFEGLNYITEECEFQDTVCRISVKESELYSWDLMEAGIPEQLSKIILDSSGYVSIEEIEAYINADKEEIDTNPEMQMDALIQHIYPEYNDAMLKKLSVRELIKLYSKALYVLKFYEEERTTIHFNRIHTIQEEIRGKQDINKNMVEQQKKAKRQMMLNQYGAGM